MQLILYVSDEFLRSTLTVTKPALYIETKKSIATCAHDIASVHYKIALTLPR